MLIRMRLIIMLFVVMGQCSSKKQNVVLLYIENINEVMKVLKLLDPQNPASKDVLGNIRKLVTESVYFHNVHGEVASASNFAALITGKPAVDLGIIRGKILPFDYFPSIASSGGLKLEEVTLAEALKGRGYRTWFSGFWKLGLGTHGDAYPIRHGFDTWMGVAHPHDEWCRRKGIGEVNHDKNHPYMHLLYKISFLWSLVFLLLTTLVWLKVINIKLFINLIIYTFTTSFAFYILLHLFMIQRSASCVLYYHDSIYQQPYEAKNLTLHFTQYTTKLIHLSAEHNMRVHSPFFMVLNYLKMKPPYFHSNYFRKQSTNTWSSSLLELDWSIGEIVETLKHTNLYNETVLVLTGNNNCEQSVHDHGDIVAYQRYAQNDFREVKVPTNTLSTDCLIMPLFIKDTNKNRLSSHVYEYVSVTDIYQTILDLSQSDSKLMYPNSLVRLYRKSKCLRRHSGSSAGNSSDDLFERSSESTDPSSTAAQSISNDDEKRWAVESADEDAVVETYVDDAQARTMHCEQNSMFHNRHTYMFHYYNLQKPMAITYRGQFKVIFVNYYVDGYVEKLSSPIIIDLKNSNMTYSQLEHVYENVSQLLQTHLAARQMKNTFSSEFEMPVYPWLMPCANFPRCETHGEVEDDFSGLIANFNDNR